MTEEEISTRALVTLVVLLTNIYAFWTWRKIKRQNGTTERFQNACAYMGWGATAHLLGFKLDDNPFFIASGIALLLLATANILFVFCPEKNA